MSMKAGLKPGDILAFSGHTVAGVVINLATYGIPFVSINHVGVLAESDGRLLFFDSTRWEMPCEIQGEVYLGAQAQTIENAVAAYPGKVWHYPLYRPLFTAENQRLSEYLQRTVGTPYDLLGAALSAGFLFSWLTSRLRRQCLQEVFCSEMLAATYAYIGLMPTANASRWNPNRLIRHLRRQGALARPWRLK